MFTVPPGTMLASVVHGNPPFLICALLWAGASLSLCALAFDDRVRAILRAHWKSIVTVTLITLCWRIPLDRRFFHGLEYEDSFVYIVAARQMMEHVGPRSPEAPYSISACAVGSLEDCQEWESYPEHFLGYPLVLSKLYRVVGYTPDAASVLNIVVAAFECVFVFLVAAEATGSPIVAGASSLVFAITPVFATYGIITSAEPVSNACMALVLWFCLRFILAVRSSECGPRILLYWSAFSSVILFSMTVKRENALLGVVLPVMIPLIIASKSTPTMRRRTLILLVFTTVALAALLSIEMGLWQTTGGEIELTKTFPITAKHLVVFFLGFARSFVVPKWYMGAVLAVAAGIVLSVRRKDLNVVTVVLFISFFIVYALHIRSYYEMQSNKIEASSALRFSMNLMCLWSLLAGIGIEAGIRRAKAGRIYAAHKSASGVVGYCLILAVMAGSFSLSKQLRDDAVDDEVNVRIFPAQIAMRLAGASSHGSSYIVTLEPFMVQMYGNTAAKVVDLSAVSSEQLRGLIASPSGVSYGFVALEETHDETEADYSRYGDQLRYLHSLPVSDLYRARHFEVVRILHR